MKKFLVTSLVICAFLTGCKKSAPQTQQDKPFDYQKVTLENGLTVITLEDFSCPIVAVQVWYQVGSKDENPNRQGFAHMFEHMMFRGTDTLGPEEHFSLIRKVGGTTNGYTSFDRTIYLETLPAEQLDLALWLESERMAFLRITKEDFATERKVVEEELRLRTNKPYGTVWEKLFDGIYEKHPYRWMPIGQLSHIRAASVDELHDFWLKYYGPNNATLIIVGAVEHSKAQAMAKKYFSWIESPATPPRVSIKEPPITESKEIIIKGEKAPAPVVGIGWRTVPISHKDSITIDLLSEIIGSGKSSRAHIKLVDAERLAIAVESGTYALQQDGLIGIGAVMNPLTAKPDKVIKELKNIVADIRDNGITETELLKAKNQMLKGTVVDNLTINNKARLLGAAAVEVGDIEYANRIVDDIKSITADDIKIVANKYLTDQKIFEVRVKKNILGELFNKSSDQEDALVNNSADVNDPIPGRGTSTRPADYPKQPPFAKAKNTKLNPEIKRTTLDNGLKILVVPNNEVEFVTVKLGLLYGAWSEQKTGSCSMAMKMLTLGTQNYTAQQLAEELETYAISLGASGGMDTSAVGMSCLSKEIDRGVSLMAEAVLRPTFPADEFEKEKIKLLTNLKIEEQSPKYLANKELKKQIFGDHPYSRTATGRTDAVKQLQVANTKKWWDTFSTPNKAVLIFAGDITEQKASELASKHFGNWETKPVPAIELPGIPKNTDTHIYIVDDPKSTQSQIRVGQLGITRKVQPEYFTSRIVCDYFGFGFDSRLNKSVRIEKGLTYAIWGGYFADNFAGRFSISTFSKTDTTADAVRSILEQIDDLVHTGPTDEELTNSISYMTGSFVLNRETPQQIADDLWLIESQDLGDDYLDQLLNSIQNTTPEDCMALIEKTIQPDKMVVIVVGDAKKIEPELAKIAPVTMVK